MKLNSNEVNQIDALENLSARTAALIAEHEAKGADFNLQRCDLDQFVLSRFSSIRRIHESERVFFAELDGQPVAVKVFSANMGFDDRGLPVGRPEVANELQLLASLRHPGVVSNIACLQAPSTLYAVFPRFEGGDLHSFVQRDGPLPPSQALALLRDLATTLAFLHDKGIAHRDVKPEKVFLSRATSGALRAVLGDFELATLTSPSPEARARVGTRQYASPELFDGCYRGPECDAWSLRLVLFFALKAALPVRRECSMLDQQRFGLVSDRDARDLCLGLCETDAERRLTPREALQHPWTRGLATAVALERLSPTKAQALQPLRADEAWAAARAEMAEKPLGRARAAFKQSSDCALDGPEKWRGKNKSAEISGAGAEEKSLFARILHDADGERYREALLDCSGEAEEPGSIPLAPPPDPGGDKTGMMVPIELSVSALDDGGGGKNCVVRAQTVAHLSRKALLAACRVLFPELKDKFSHRSQVEFFAEDVEESRDLIFLSDSKMIRKWVKQQGRPQLELFFRFLLN